MMIHPDDRVLVAVMNNEADWQRVQDQQWYRIPVKYAPEPVPNIDWLAFFFTAAFAENRWAIHYYAPVKGHELLTRRDMLPAEAGHKHANRWYYRLDIGPVQHRLPPIVADRWRRVTFIFTTGDRFEAAVELKDLLKDTDPTGNPFVTLRETGRVIYRPGP
jgi:hypothetical protein